MHLKFFYLGCAESSCFVSFFLWLLWRRRGAPLSCGSRASHCSGCFCCRAQAPGAWASVLATHGLSSCGSWALSEGSIVVAHGSLVVPKACGIFLDQGSNRCPLHWQVGLLSTVPRGKSITFYKMVNWPISL